jgi:hypothetical protein
LHQLLRKSLHAHRIAFGVAVLDAKVLADRPAHSFKTLFEGPDASLGLRIVCEAHQHPDGAHAKFLCIPRDRLGANTPPSNVMKSRCTKYSHLAMEGERDPARLHDRALGELIRATTWRD